MLKSFVTGTHFSEKKSLNIASSLLNFHCKELQMAPKKIPFVTTTTEAMVIFLET